jgi:RNA polymerase sigma-70 factor (ECF subfamily)
LSEKELIRQILSGNTHAFELIVNQHKAMVYSLALRICSHTEDAEELAQDVFMRVFENLSSYRGESQLKTWIYKIAFNWCMNKTRTKRKYEQVSFDTQFHLVDEDLNPFEQLTQTEQKVALQRALEEMDKIDSIVLTLFYFEELNINEIAESLSFSKSNVKVKLFRARKKLIEIVEQKNFLNHE